MVCARKRIVPRISVVCCFICIFFTSLPAWARSLSLEAGSAVLMDMRSKRLLYEQDSARKIPPASLTKVMSMFIALDAVKAGRLSLRAPVRVSRAAARAGGSSMHLKAGERLRLDDLLRGMAVASANDAAAAVAEHVAGSQANFVAMMNRKAARLGMKSTTFKTPHGLPARGQLTTAADMLLLTCRYLEAHPGARAYHGTPAIIRNGAVIQNTNKLLGHDSISGLKTGFTRKSGYNIILTGKRHGREMIGVLMRAPSVEIRSREAQRLLEYGADMHLSSGKKPAGDSGGRLVKNAKASPAHPEKLAVRSPKGKKTRNPAYAAGGKVRNSPPLPRRILPQTASLPASAQGSQVR